MKRFYFVGLFIMVFCTIAYGSDKIVYDLNGKWEGNNGESFFIRQVGDEVWWLCEPDASKYKKDPPYIQVGHGYIKKD